LELSVLSRNPKDIGGAIIVHCTTCNEEKIRETVDVFESCRCDVFARLVPKLDYETLGATANGACEVQICGSRTSTRQDERS
jgi:hypothetical protein